MLDGRRSRSCRPAQHDDYAVQLDVQFWSRDGQTGKAFTSGFVNPSLHLARRREDDAVLGAGGLRVNTPGLAADQKENEAGHSDRGSKGLFHG